MGRTFYISFFVISLFFAEHLFAQQKIIAIYQEFTENEEDSFNYRLFATSEKSKYDIVIMNETFVNSSEGQQKGFNYISRSVMPLHELHNNYKQDSFNLYLSVNEIRIHVVDKAPSLNWEIGSESKEIGGYTCIKAEVSFRGRDYIAWFAPSIGIPAGPWKFYGLPGLIMEVKDKEGVFACKLLSLEELQKDISEELIPPKRLDYKNIPLKDFDNLQAKLLEQSEDLFQARLRSRGVKVLETIEEDKDSFILEKYEWKEAK